MKKIRTIFYGAYLLYIIFGIFIGANYESLVLRWEWDWIDTWVSLIRFVMKMGALGIVLLITQIALENWLSHIKNNKINDLENQVTALKAKLYDKSQETIERPLESTEVISESHEENNTPK